MNPRLWKIDYWLHQTRDPAEAIKLALIQNGSHGTPRAQETASALLRNLTILERLGCLDNAGLDKLRRGNAPTITRGPYAGELATGDHIIPRSVAPELDNKLFNLEFMPDTLNRRSTIEERITKLERVQDEARRANCTPPYHMTSPKKMLAGVLRWLPDTNPIATEDAE